MKEPRGNMDKYRNSDRWKNFSTGFFYGFTAPIVFFDTFFSALKKPFDRDCETHKYKEDRRADMDNRNFWPEDFWPEDSSWLIPNNSLVDSTDNTDNIVNDKITKKRKMEGKI